ncbi:FadR/GntR family transcriptional regulator [Sulfitobacter sp. F26204]|uniref:FadR/GntR family transcriptional regulator n=1 Tax=Sulfitobacter sp. F26204 TaxID=2996014 RepID=UPI00225E5245|nr:FadR/GntR family transcriptional regulator [Sulfitobacter sp. F26204]MCX7558382.1 FadR/GntR family transcriptional regulator [Sulfitobacter sp. F26204]
MQQTDFLPKLATYLIGVAESNAGKAPSERELAEHFTVSRGQVRESLAILEAMQVIERRAKSGIYLRKDQRGIEQLAFFARAGLPVDPRQIYEAVEVRKIHEIKAAELAAERATEENFSTLEDILARSEARIAAGEGLSKLDHDFHLEIVRATQNEVFYNLCTTFYVLSEKRLSIYFKEGDRNLRSHQEHQQIYEALRRRDGALSMALMNSHLRGAMSYWSELLDVKETNAL